MSKFKVGDKVSANAVYGAINADYVDWQDVTVVHIDPSGRRWPITVIGSEKYPGVEGAFDEDELDLVTE